jgi:hypothetical protein
MEKELERLKQAAAALEDDLHSDDKKVAAAAEKALRKLGADLKALATKHGLKVVVNHEEQATGPEPRRRCAPTISTVINGKIHVCILVGKEGRKCLYSCSPATLSPV